MLGDLSQWVTTVIETLGYPGVAFLVALESVFPPIPSEIVLPLAGFVAGRGDASFIGMVAAATAGSMVGAWILYALAAAIGPVRLRALIGRYGRWFGVKIADLERAEAWFDRRSTVAVFLGRCVPLIRSIVSVPAGFRRMPILRFTVATALGSLLWNLALIGAGALLGERWEQTGDVVGVVQWIVIMVIVVAIAWFIWRRILRPRFVGDGATPESPSPPGSSERSE